LKFEYVEVKDVLKSLLTILVAVLVGSIAFAEKIVDVQKTTPFAHQAMFASWILLFLAIAACGVGFTYLGLAAGKAAYDAEAGFRDAAGCTLFSTVCAGLFFAGGLIALVSAGLSSLLGSVSELKRLNASGCPTPVWQPTPASRSLGRRS